MKKGKKIKVIQKSSIENSVDLIHQESMRFNGFGAGTGAHRNKKLDKKLRREDGKRQCRDWDN